LQLMLARAGFDVGPICMLRHTDWIRRSAQLAAQRPETPSWQRWLRKRWVARLAIWYAYLLQRCDSMMVTALKTAPVSLEPEPAFSSKSAQHPRSPADRWRNT
jgi:hypothetical protein